MKKYKTIVYVDGFNLYYGVLKGTPYKWLNIDALIKNLLVNNEIISLKYFTSPVKADSKNISRRKDQETYILALQDMIPYFECIYGYIVERKVNAKHTNPPPYSVNVSLREEKETDVNIAVEIVKDSCLKDIDCVVLVSNDSDLSRALLITRELGKKIILITPRQKDAKSRISIRLKKLADYHFFYINDKVLAKSIFPEHVGKHIRPRFW